MGAVSHSREPRWGNGDWAAQGREKGRGRRNTEMWEKVEGEELLRESPAPGWKALPGGVSALLGPAEPCRPSSPSDARGSCRRQQVLGLACSSGGRPRVGQGGFCPARTRVPADQGEASASGSPSVTGAPTQRATELERPALHSFLLCSRHPTPCSLAKTHTS